MKLILIKWMQRNYERKLARYSLIFKRILKPVIQDQEARFMQKLLLITKPTFKNIMDIEQENHIVSLAMRPVYISVATEAAEELLGQHKMFIKSVSPRMLLSQKIFDYADKYSIAMAKYINKTTSKKIKKLIEQGFRDNLTYGQMAKKIKTNIFKDLSQGYRAKMVARTEAHGMVENGSFEAAKASKVIKEKTWSAAADARETHGNANYQTVKLTDQYVVGGYLLDFPGDTSYGAGLEEIVNCRCSSLYSSRIHKDRIQTTKELLERYEKPITLPRRGHLPANMNPDECMHRLIADAKERGINLEYEDARAMYNSVHAYTSTGSDQGIRIFQHGGLQGLKNAGYSPSEIKRLMKEAKNLEKFLKISVKYKEDMIFRGLKLEPEVWGRFAPGQIMDMQGASSFSSDFLAARNKGNVVFGLMKNKTGVSVRHISGWPAEKEILFSNLAKFRITGIKSTEMGVFVSLEEITFAPKLKLIVPITRGHLSEKMLSSDRIKQVMLDARSAGVKLTEKEAAQICKDLNDFSTGKYVATNVYEASGVTGLKNKYGMELTQHHVKIYKRISVNVEKYIEFAPKYNGKVVYRNIKLLSPEKDIFLNLKPGNIIDMKGTRFWTSKSSVADKFGNIKFIVKNPKNSVSVKHLTYWYNEDPIFFVNKTKFEVLNIIKTKDGANVFLKEVIPKPKLIVPVWKPVMTQAEADAWAKGSKFANDTFYHGTSKKSATEIGIEGFKISELGTNTQNGGMFGKGHYLTQSKAYAEPYSQRGLPGEVLRVKINLQNVLTDQNKIGQIGLDSDKISVAASHFKELSLSEAKKKASSIVRDSLDLINEKDWVQITKLMKNEKFPVESIRSYMFKKNGYDGVFHHAYQELVIFDDKNLVVIQREIAKLPTAMKATAEQLRKSLEAYQDGAFQPINELLRNQKIVPAQLSKIMPDIANMDSLMKASTNDFYLYRGDGAGISANLFPGVEGLPTRISAEQALYGRIDGKTYAQFLNDKLKGKIFKDAGFISTSMDSQLVIDRFVSGNTELTEHGAVGFVEIIAPKGTKMINVENISLMGARESEKILSRGTAFKIEMVDIKPYPSESATVRFYIRYLVSIVKVH